MKELVLKYGCNPNQKPAKIYMENGSELPIKVLCGNPGYINLLDALNGWQLVSELKKVSNMPAATSFKHVSPAGAAIGLELDEVLKKIYWVDDLTLSPLASAYANTILFKLMKIILLTILKKSRSSVLLLSRDTTIWI